MNLILCVCAVLFSLPQEENPSARPLRPPVRVVVGGVVAPLTMPPQVIENELLAPIGDQLPRLGATFSYDPDSGSILVETLTKQAIEFQVGSNLMTRDGNSTQIAAAPVIREGVVWLPVFQVASALGAHAHIDADSVLWINPRLKDVRIEPSKRGTEIHIDLSSSAKFRVGRLPNPDRIYIDIEHADLGLTPGELYQCDQGNVLKVRVAQFSLSPDVCRVVLELDKAVDYRIESPVETHQFTLRVGEALPEKTVDAHPGVGTRSDLAGLRIVVDAGHGGHDQGATGLRGTLEKHVNLDIALRLAARLSELGASVIMTRTDDYFVTLSGRCKIANDSGAHIFVSVHVNAWPKANGKCGTEVYYTTPHSLPLATAVHESMITMLKRRDGGLRRRGLYVTHHTLMPSVLTETAYINHVEEEKLLNDPQFRQRAAEAIAQGIVNYAKSFLMRASPVAYRNSRQFSPRREK